MLKDLREYIGFCFPFSFRGSWDTANNLIGAVVAGALMIRPGVIDFFHGTGQDVISWNGLASFALYTIVAFVGISVLKLVLVAPFVAWRNEKSKQTMLQERLDALKEELPDLPLGDAIAYIKRVRMIQGDCSAIQQKLFQLARLGKVTVWGKEKREFPSVAVGSSIHSDTLAPIRKELFNFVEGSQTPWYGYHVQVSESTPGWFAKSPEKEFFHITVNRAQIDTNF